jgi:hypothetical protein
MIKRDETGFYMLHLKNWGPYFMFLDPNVDNSYREIRRNRDSLYLSTPKNFFWTIV